jgi:hypothetical protein
LFNGLLIFGAQLIIFIAGIAFGKPTATKGNPGRREQNENTRRLPDFPESLPW